MDDLEETRKEAWLKKYDTNTGSDNFQVMAFQLNSVASELHHIFVFVTLV